MSTIIQDRWQNYAFRVLLRMLVMLSFNHVFVLGEMPSWDKVFVAVMSPHG